MSSGSKSYMLIDIVDSETRDSIMRLNQKLKGLQAEISTKLDFFKATNEAEQERQEQLSTLANEINKALLSINTLVRTEIADEITPEQFLQMNQAELDKFRKMVKANSEQLIKLGEDF